MGRSNDLQQTTEHGQAAGRRAYAASPIPIRRGRRCVNTGGSAALGMHGQGAARPALTQIRTVPTHQEKWCGFSSSTGRVIDPAGRNALKYVAHISSARCCRISGYRGADDISALVRLQRAATADNAVGSSAQVGIDLVNEWSDARIIGKPFMAKFPLERPASTADLRHARRIEKKWRAGSLPHQQLDGSNTLKRPSG